MQMKNPPHPGLSARHDCLEPLGLSQRPQGGQNFLHYALANYCFRPQLDFSGLDLGQVEQIVNQ